MPISRLSTRIIVFVLLLGPTLSANAQELATLTTSVSDTPQYQNFEAVIEAVKRSTVSAETRGRVTDVLFDVADYVKKGAVIINIANREQKARLDAAAAKVEEATAKTEVAQAEFTRIKNVHEKGLVSKSVFDKASADLKAAQQVLNSAQANYRQTKEQLKYSVVKAPYSGLVVEKHIEVGEMANVGQPLLTGISIDQLRAISYVPQQFIKVLRQSKTAYIESDNNKTISSEDITIYPEADPNTHNFKVRVQLPDNTEDIYPGMVVRIRFAVGSSQKLLIPESALVKRSELTAVYVMDSEQRLSLRQVKTGRTHPDGNIEILSGLQANEKIALNPVAAAMAYKSVSAAK